MPQGALAAVAGKGRGRVGRLRRRVGRCSMRRAGREPSQYPSVTPSLSWMRVNNSPRRRSTSTSGALRNSPISAAE